MSWLCVAMSRVRGLLSKGRLERELDDEIRFHLQMQIEDNVKAGMNPSEVRYAAMRSFGAIEPMKEAYRERRALAWMETTAQDVRYAIRTLSKSPGFTATTVSVLALAIGANTAMFSLLNAVLLRPLPYSNPEQLAMLWTEVPSQNVREGRSAYWNIEQWRAQSKSFTDIAFFDSASATLASDDGADQISVVRHSANLLPLLGVQPLKGRIFSNEEAEQRQHVVLISYQFWQTRFGGSLDAIGSTIEIDGTPSQIIGVLPEAFPLPQLNGDVWESHTIYRDWETLRRARGSGFWFVVGRLRPNVTLERAQAEMSAIARRLDQQLPINARNLGISVVPLLLQITGNSARLTLWLLTGAVFCVLLVAATNVASLSLARNARRERELAIRTALGASRLRIVRQLLAESLTVAVVSSLLGLAIAHAGIRLILATKPANLARLSEAGLDPHVLTWTLTISLFTAILVGLLPAITVAGRAPRLSSNEGGRSIASGVTAHRTRRLLVVTEFALAILLLAGAGLFVRSLWSAEGVDLGFQPARVLSMQLSTTAFETDAGRTGFYSDALERVASLHGVESAGLIGDLFVGGSPEQSITVEASTQSVTERLRFRSDEVSEGVFRTLQVPLLRGRFFSAADGPDSPPVAIINAAMARRLWPGLDALGRRFKPGAAEAKGPWFTVVGIVGDMRRQGLEHEPIAQMFVPLAQNPTRLATLLVRTSADDPRKLASTIQAAVHRVEKRVPLYGVTTLDDRLNGFLAERRFQTSLLLGFSAVALLMAAVGIYGLFQYSVATRTNEIGIRVAVGAQSGAIFRMILHEGLKLSLTGLAFGLAGALWLGRAASSLLFGVTATDPATFVTVSALLTAVALAACYFPARRAMKVDPMVALRHE